MAALKLRFHDEQGREYPEWKEKSIESLGTFFNGLSGKTKLDFENGNEYFIPYMNVYKNAFAQTDQLQKVKIKEEEKQNRVNYGDIMFTQSSETVEEVGLSSVWLGENHPFLNSFCLGLRLTDVKNSVPVFWGFSLRSPSVRKQIMLEGQGISRINLSPNRLKKITVFCPSLPEQQKIADFLTAYDTMIDTQTKRVEAMKVRKKGLLQKIFSQEIRFKNDNGQNYPEWEKKTVGSLANNIVGGGTPSTKNPAFYAGEIPWISSSDLVEDKINYLNITRFITQDAINRSATKLIPAQSVMIVCRVGVGKVAVNELPLCTSQDFMNLIVKEENSPVFIGYLLMNLMVKRRNSVQGTAIKGIPSAEIKKFKVLVPALPEQQKIADFLTTVDAQIDAEEKRLETMKTIKKGLLQQMFI